MKISVIIPTFNAHNYLIRSVASVLTQTLDEIELIIVDDGSTDDTPELCRNLKNEYCNIKVIRQQNMGSMEARITGIKNAIGDFLFFLDVDDWIKPNALETLYRIAMDKESDIVFFESWIVYNETAYPYKIINATEEELNKDPIDCFFDFKVPNALWTKLIKRSYLEQNQIKFPLTISCGEDIAATGCMLMFNPRVSFCLEPLYYYFQREDSLMHTFNESHFEVFKSISFLGEQLLENNLFDRYKQKYIDLALYYFTSLYQKVRADQQLTMKFNYYFTQWKTNFELV